MPLFPKSKPISMPPADTVLAQLIGNFRQFVEQYNAQIDDPSLSFTVAEHEVTADRFRRTLISNSYWILSFRAEKAWVKGHLFRTRDLVTSMRQETALNLKLALHVVRKGKDIQVRLDNQTVVSQELPTLALSLFEELVRRSQSATQFDKKPSLTLDGKSIASTVRCLIHERNSLLNELLSQNELIHNNIAREIHDSVISDLLFLKQTQQSRQAPEGELELVEQAVAALRDICSGLSSRDLKDWGLMPCLEDLIKKTRRKTEVEIVFEALGTVPDFPIDVTVQVFRIIQEAMNNSLKHASPTRVRVVVRNDGSRFKVTISDDGTGLADRRKSGGTGLHIMNERATMISTLLPCDLTIGNASPAGTEVCLQISTAG